MLVQFKLTNDERDLLLAHAGTNSPRWKLLMQPQANLDTGEMTIRCEQGSAVELLGIAVASSDSAARAIAKALRQALDA